MEWKRSPKMHIQRFSVSSMLYWSCCESNCYIVDESDDENGDERCRSAMKMRKEVKMEIIENDDDNDEEGEVKMEIIENDDDNDEEGERMLQMLRSRSRLW
ncbi:unnamed protein product [Vicia faba]|uniref:Uncharacterized protein n=1 Tax=Vicia faba TaxID=3906 RepID=A0AAV0ZUD9_VICFA|nr:unnamed protein product [Vicia faba]